MKKQQVIIWLLFSGVFAYLLLRGIYVTFTHDEIATFFRFVHLGRFLPFDSEWTTNNHILNSALTIVSYKIFGYSVFAQRLPNLLFIPFFFLFLYRTSGLIRSKALQWAFILIILLMHQFMDFFSLSRGYGMAMTLLMGAVFYTQRALRDGKSVDYAASMIFLLFAVSALLLLINTFILVVMILMLNTIINDRGHRRRQVINSAILFVGGIAPIVFFTVYLLGLQEVGRIDYGGAEGFWAVSVEGLTELLFGKLSGAINILVVAFTVLILVLFTSTLFNRSFNIKQIRPGSLFFYLLVGNIVASHAEHFLFGVLYPDARAVIYMIIFFTGSLVFLLDEAPWPVITLKTVLLLPFAFLPFHFAGSVNLSHSITDKGNFRIPASFYDTIASRHMPGDYPPTIQGYQLRAMHWNYINFSRMKELATIQYNSYPSMLADFQIVEPDAFPSWLDAYTVSTKAEDSPLVLLERKNRLRKELILQHASESQGTTDALYFGLMEASMDSLAGYSLRIGFRLNIASPARPIHAWVVAEVRNGDGEAVRYEYVPLDWFRTDWDDPAKTFVNGLLIETLPEGSETLKVYLWNIYQDPFSLDSAVISLFRLREEGP